MNAGAVDALDVSERAVRMAACLVERYADPAVAAFGRIGYCGAESRMWSGKFRRAAPSAKRDRFWLSVALLIGTAYMRRGCPTNYELAARQAIDGARKALAAQEAHRRL